MVSSSLAPFHIYKIELKGVKPTPLATFGAFTLTGTLTILESYFNTVVYTLQ
jgi:hypothetical protein